MKHLAILMLLFPTGLLAQTTSTHSQAMGKFQTYFNSRQGDSINAMYGKYWDEMKTTKALWTNEKAVELNKELGDLISFEFIGIDKSDPQQVYVYKTVFSQKGEVTTSLTLDEDHKLATFRLVTTSDEISRLLRKSKNQ